MSEAISGAVLERSRISLRSSGLLAEGKAWMAGTSPAMTGSEISFKSFGVAVSYGAFNYSFSADGG